MVSPHKTFHKRKHSPEKSKSGLWGFKLPGLGIFGSQSNFGLPSLWAGDESQLAVATDSDSDESEIDNELPFDSDEDNEEEEGEDRIYRDQEVDVEDELGMIELENTAARTMVRLGVLICLTVTGIVFIALSISGGYLYTNVTYQLQVDQAVSLQSVGCDVEFEVDEDAALPQLWGEHGGGSLSTDTSEIIRIDDGFNFLASRASNSNSPCQVVFKVPLDGAFPALTVTLTGRTSFVATSSDNTQPFSFGTNDLTIQSTVEGIMETVVFLSDMEVGNLQVDVSSGAVELEGVRLQGGQVSSLDGDVSVIATIGMDVTFTQNSGRFCFNAPQQSVDPTYSFGDDGTTVVGATGTATVCPTSVDCSADALPQLTLSSNRNVLVFSQSDDDESTVLEEKGIGLSGLTFDRQTTTEIQAVREFWAEEPGTDIYVWFNILNDVEEARWVFTNRVVYLQLSPVWLSAFSASLLKPRNMKIAGRFEERACLYDQTKEDNIESTYQLFKDILEVVEPEVIGRITEQSTLRFKDAADTVDEREVHMWDNVGLAIAVPASFFLSVVGSLVFTYLCLWLCSHQSSEHRERVKVAERVKLLRKAIKKGTETKTRDDGKQRHGYSLQPIGGVENFQLMPFDIPDLITSTLRLSRVDSLKRFLNERCVLVDINVGLTEDISLKEFSQAYQEYCSVCNLTERPIRDKKGMNTLARLGVELVGESGGNTDVYTKIRFQNRKREDDSLLDFSGVDSLSLFIADRCEITGIPHDTINRKLFKEEYENWCDARSMDALPLLKSEFHRRSIGFEQRVVFYVRGLRLKSEEELLQESRIAGWWFWEIVVVLTDLLFVFILPAPLLAIAFWVQHEYQELGSLVHYHDEVTFDDVVHRPWTLDSADATIMHQNFVIVVFMVVFWAVGILELYAHYLSFRGDAISTPTSLGRRVLQYTFLFFIMLVFSAWFGYGLMVLTYFMLGAVLNPTIFLPYAAAAATLCGSLYYKYSLIQELRGRVKMLIIDVVRRKLQSIIEDNPLGDLVTMATEEIGSKLSGDTADEKVGGGLAGGRPNSGSEKGQVVTSVSSMVGTRLVQNSGFSGIVDALNLTAEIASGLTTGNVRDIMAMSRVTGMHPTVAFLVTSIARRDAICINKGLEAMAEQIGVSDDVVNALMSLKTAAPVESLNYAVKVLMKNYSDGTGIVVDPRTVQAVIDLASGNPQPLADAMKHVHEDVPINFILAVQTLAAIHQDNRDTRKGVAIRIAKYISRNKTFLDSLVSKPLLVGKKMWAHPSTWCGTGKIRGPERLPELEAEEREILDEMDEEAGTSEVVRLALDLTGFLTGSLPAVGRFCNRAQVEKTAVQVLVASIKGNKLEARRYLRGLSLATTGKVEALSPLAAITWGVELDAEDLPSVGLDPSVVKAIGQLAQPAIQVTLDGVKTFSKLFKLDSELMIGAIALSRGIYQMGFVSRMLQKLGLRRPDFAADVMALACATAGETPDQPISNILRQLKVQGREAHIVHLMLLRDKVGLAEELGVSVDKLESATAAMYKEGAVKDFVLEATAGVNKRVTYACLGWLEGTPLQLFGLVTPVQDHKDTLKYLYAFWVNMTTNGQVVNRRVSVSKSAIKNKQHDPIFDISMLFRIDPTTFKALIAISRAKAEGIRTLLSTVLGVQKDTVNQFVKNFEQAAGDLRRIADSLQNFALGCGIPPEFVRTLADHASFRKAKILKTKSRYQAIQAITKNQKKVVVDGLVGMVAGEWNDFAELLTTKSKLDRETAEVYVAILVALSQNHTSMATYLPSLVRRFEMGSDLKPGTAATPRRCALVRALLQWSDPKSVEELAAATGVPVVFFRVIVAMVDVENKSLMEIRRNIARATVDVAVRALRSDHTMSKGLISIANGQVTDLEEFCSLLHVDQDIAQGLVALSNNGSTVGDSIDKLARALNVDAQLLQGLLAVMRADYSDPSVDGLARRFGMHVAMLRSFIALQSRHEMSQIREALAPICEAALFTPKQQDMLAAVVSMTNYAQPGHPRITKALGLKNSGLAASLILYLNDPEDGWKMADIQRVGVALDIPSRVAKVLYRATQNKMSSLLRLLKQRGVKQSPHKLKALMRKISKLGLAEKSKYRMDVKLDEFNEAENEGGLLSNLFGVGRRSRTSSGSQDMSNGNLSRQHKLAVELSKALGLGSSPTAGWKLGCYISLCHGYTFGCDEMYHGLFGKDEVDKVRMLFALATYDHVMLTNLPSEVVEMVLPTKTLTGDVYDLAIFMRIISGDETMWETERARAISFIEPTLAQALQGLIHKKESVVLSSLHSVVTHFHMNVDQQENLRAILTVAMGNQAAIPKVAQTLNIPVSVCRSFTAGVANTLEEVEAALGPLCHTLKWNPSIAARVVMCARGSLSSLFEIADLNDRQKEHLDIKTIKEMKQTQNELLESFEAFCRHDLDGAKPFFSHLNRELNFGSEILEIICALTGDVAGDFLPTFADTLDLSKDILKVVVAVPSALWSLTDEDMQRFEAALSLRNVHSEWILKAANGDLYCLSRLLTCEMEEELEHPEIPIVLTLLQETKLEEVIEKHKLGLDHMMKNLGVDGSQALAIVALITENHEILKDNSAVFCHNKTVDGLFEQIFKVCTSRHLSESSWEFLSSLVLKTSADTKLVASMLQIANGDQAGLINIAPFLSVETQLVKGWMNLLIGERADASYVLPTVAHVLGFPDQVVDMMFLFLNFNQDSEYFGRFCEFVDMKPSHVRGFLALANEDWEGATSLMGDFGSFEPQKVQRLVHLIRQLNLSGLERKATEEAHVVVKMHYGDQNKSSFLFRMFDKNSSGTIDFAEFSDILRYQNIHLSTEKAMLLFARCDLGGNGDLDFNEFARAEELLEIEVSEGALVQLGISTTHLVGVLMSLFLTLSVIFLFLFAGIVAFTTGSDFGAVCSSILPLGSGAVVTSSSDNESPSSIVKKAAQVAEDIVESLLDREE